MSGDLLAFRLPPAVKFGLYRNILDVAPRLKDTLPLASRGIGPLDRWDVTQTRLTSGVREILCCATVT